MSAIDMHAHAFPDGLAPRAINALEDNCPWKAVAGGTVRELLASMDAADVDISVVCTIATRPDQVKGIFKWCKDIRDDRIVPLPSIHPQTSRKAHWMKKFAKEGFAGVKLHPLYQDFAVDDAVMDEVYAVAEELELFVECHCGRDIAFPPSDDRASPRRIRRVIDRFPDLRFIATHMGGWRMWDEVEAHLLGEPVYMETSFSLTDLEPRRAADIIRRHGVDRVMFGTDWPWASQDVSLRLFRNLPLDEKERSAILIRNAAALLGF